MGDRIKSLADLVGLSRDQLEWLVCAARAKAYVMIYQREALKEER